MIYDTLDHIDLYKDVHPRIYQALQVLRDTDFSKLEKGTYEVDGKNLYYMVQEYNTKLEGYRPESHFKYADIQFEIEGEENFGVLPLDAAGEALPTDNPEKDIRFYDADVDFITLKGKRFVVLFPQDVHAPAVAINGESKPVRKCVVKVLL